MACFTWYVWRRAGRSRQICMCSVHHVLTLSRPTVRTLSPMTASSASSSSPCARYLVALLLLQHSLHFMRPNRLVYLSVDRFSTLAVISAVLKVVIVLAHALSSINSTYMGQLPLRHQTRLYMTAPFATLQLGY